MSKPVRYRGKYIVTTKGGKPLAVCCSLEQAEYWLDQGRNRKLYAWVNDSLQNEYGYVLYRTD